MVPAKAEERSIPTHHWGDNGLGILEYRDRPPAPFHLTVPKKRNMISYTPRIKTLLSRLTMYEVSN
jgi:hypothetical protein